MLCLAARNALCGHDTYFPRLLTVAPRLSYCIVPQASRSLHAAVLCAAGLGQATIVKLIQNVSR
jgi:hypothetical protein